MTADEARRIYDKLDEIHKDLRAREVEHVTLCGRVDNLEQCQARSWQVVLAIIVSAISLAINALPRLWELLTGR